MKKVIKVDIKKESDAIHKFDSDIISNELIQYILKESMPYGEVKIEINKLYKTKKVLKNMLLSGFKSEYEKCFLETYHYNILQMFFVALGILFLYLSSKVSDAFIWKEILLISGWVPVWETVHLEIVEDVRIKRKRKALRKLINCEIVEN